MYQITFNLQNGFCANFPIMLDALIRAFMEYEGIETVPFEYDEYLGIYKASAILIPNDYLDRVIIMRSQIEANRLHKLNPKSANRKIKIASGKFKQRQVPMQKMITNKAVAFFKGDKEIVSYLLNKYLLSLGVKNNQSGRVLSIEISDFKDFNFYDKLLRPLPIEFAQQKGFIGQIRPCRLTFPYYLQSDKQLCVCPDFQIQL